MCKAELIEVLRDIGEEIHADEPAPKKCPHGRSKYSCKEFAGKGIKNTNEWDILAKTVMGKEYVFI